MDEELRTLEQRVQELTNVNNALLQEIRGLRTKYAATENTPLIVSGDEEDYYPGEVRDLLLEILADAMNRQQPGSRRADILADILQNNASLGMSGEKRERIKNLLRGYRTMTSVIRQELYDLGFEISEEGRHYKLVYYGDSRYTLTMACTASDNRSGQNAAAEIARKVL